MTAILRRLGRAAAMAGLLVALLGAAARPAAEIEGRVTRVTDGDSLWLQPATAGAPVEVRLVDIDAPEQCQPWGAEAKEALKMLVEGKTVTLRAVGRDDYGRMLGRLSLDGLDVNAHLVQEGHAWSARGRNDRGPLLKEERSAKALGRGLHGQRGAVMPRDFRRSHGPCVHAAAPGTSAAARTSSSVPAVAPVAVGPTAGKHCDGRLYCSQMNSCAEATWFMQHCPGVQMDGDRDGVPCETQWCRR